MIGAALVMAEHRIPTMPGCEDDAGNFYLAGGWKGATADPKRIERNQRWADAVACSVPLHRAGLVVFDSDGPDGLARLLALFECETTEELRRKHFVIQSKRGPNVWTLRPECLADSKRSWVYSAKRSAESLGEELDVVCGTGKVLDRKKTWLSNPGMIGECPPLAVEACERMVEAYRSRRAEAAAKAERRRVASEAEWQRRLAENARAADRGDAYADSALSKIVANVSAMKKGVRNTEGNTENFNVGGFVGAAWNSLSEDVAVTQLMIGYRQNGQAAEMGDAACERWVRKGVRDGMAHPKPPPEDRPDWTPAKPVEVKVEAKPLKVHHVKALRRAIAGAMALSKASGARGEGIATRAHLGAAVAREMIAQRKDTVALGNLRLATRIGCTPSTVSRQRDGVVEAFGFELQAGGLDDVTGEATATVWRFSPDVLLQVASLRSQEGWGDDPTAWKALGCKLQKNSAPLGKGLRARKLRPDSERDLPALECEQVIRLSRPGIDCAWHLEQLGEAHPDELAEAEGCSSATARRACEELVSAGAAAREQVKAGGRGRPRVVYRWLGWPAELLETLVDMGVRAVERMIDSAETARRQIAEARRVAKRDGVAFKVAFKAIRQRDGATRERRHAKQSRTDQRNRQQVMDRARAVGREILRFADSLGARGGAEVIRARDARERRARFGSPIVSVEVGPGDPWSGRGWRRALERFKAGTVAPMVADELLPEGWC